MIETKPLKHADGTRCAGDRCAWKGDDSHLVQYEVTVLRSERIAYRLDARDPEDAKARYLSEGDEVGSKTIGLSVLSVEGAV